MPEGARPDFLRSRALGPQFVCLGVALAFLQSLYGPNSCVLAPRIREEAHAASLGISQPASAFSRARLTTSSSSPTRMTKTFP